MKKLFALTLVLALTFGAGTAALAAWRTTGVGVASASAGSLAQPAAPSAGRQASTPTTVDLAWTAVPAATGYVVHRFSDESSTTSGVQVCSTGATSCADVNASADSAHWYRLTATRGTWSSPISGTAHIPASVVTTAMSSTISATVVRRGASANWYSVATVIVTDDVGSPVQGAVVDYQWNGGGLQACTTDASGRCNSVESGNTDAASQTFSIIDVSKAGFVWTGAVASHEVLKGS